ncbi:glycosyltransferase family 2 protein [Candidatus Microgenomates bacterium]|nr:glycosyltransferase family 2 protein [Candidatus Microgenomates bacterium]
MSNISVVINTWNEEKNLPRAIASIKNLASEIIVVDMESNDDTKEIAKKLGAKVFNHKYIGYVEPARNFALSKATGDWILILDADEEIPDRLAKKLQSISQDSEADFYRLPRKNIIFGQWIRHARWWPDYNIRFFKKDQVLWSELIHSVPETHGIGQDLPDEEPLAIVHHNYQSISQYLARLDRYTTVQAKLKIEDGYKFNWRDLIAKPSGEFVSRFLAGEGYKDGVHGLAVCLLQSFSELVLYLKIWELAKFEVINLNPHEVNNEIAAAEGEIDHWLVAKRMRRPTILTKVLRRLTK